MSTSSNSLTELTPQARLAISRRAIVRHMHKDDEHPDNQDSAASLSFDSHSTEPDNTWGVIKHAFRAWWQHHPVNTALDLAKPLVSQYAREKPLKVLGIAAGAGVAIAVLKPWRLISLGGLLLAAMKSSDISGAIFSILSPSPHDSATHRKNR